MSTERQFDDLSANEWVVYLRSMFGQMRDPASTAAFRAQLAAIPAFTDKLTDIEDAARINDQTDAAIRVTCKRIRIALVGERRQQSAAVLQQNPDYGSF